MPYRFTNVTSGSQKSAVIYVYDPYRQVTWYVPPISVSRSCSSDFQTIHAPNAQAGAPPSYRSAKCSLPTREFQSRRTNPSRMSSRATSAIGVPTEKRSLTRASKAGDLPAVCAGKFIVRGTDGVVHAVYIHVEQDETAATPSSTTERPNQPISATRQGCCRD